MSARVHVVALGALLLAGCYSFTTLGRARTVAAKHVEVFGAPEALIVTSGSGASVRPVADVGVRYGATDDVELDARLTTFGLTLGPRVQLVRSASPDSGVDLLLAPAIAWTYPDKLALEVPVAFGWNVGNGHQLVVAPRLVYQMRLDLVAGTPPTSFVYLGASVGFVLRIDSHVALLPELALLGQLYADSGTASNIAGGLGLLGAIGLLVDP